MMHDRFCPVCAHRGRTLIYSYTLVGGHHQSVWSCFQCGMVYATGTPDVDYAQDSIYACPAVFGESEFDRIRYRDTAARLFDLVRSKDEPVMDVGCATGGLLAALTATGFSEVHGMDLSQEAVDVACRRGWTAFRGGLDDPPIPHTAVVLSHVLEHVPDPGAMLDRLHQWIEPDGLLYIEVPDAARYHLVPYFAEAFNVSHINHFSPSHLAMILEKHGWLVTSLETTEIKWKDERSEPHCAIVWAAARPHPTLAQSVSSYAEGIQQRLMAIAEHFEQELAGHDQVALWGTGNVSKRLWALPELKRRQLIMATDTNPVFWGKEFVGIKIVSPADFAPAPGVPIIIGSDSRAKEITAAIRARGLANILVEILR